ncbi:hypothetical protein JTE90_001290 [Oedothorax gibbosus]|uniref:Uncharacterized protein n=1 Tax=Oedothorax gibbosus TaxID=931172 RepID=A0AAV6V3R9_9ARAC|nr:hypothetical protein JTE90_001290 [Oedothorax gibbosus]
MTRKMIFGLILAFYTVEIIAGQCITANDILVNETSVGISMRNLIEGNTRFSLDLLRTLNVDRRSDKDSSGYFQSS